MLAGPGGAAAQGAGACAGWPSQPGPASFHASHPVPVPLGHPPSHSPWQTCRPCSCPACARGAWRRVRMALSRPLMLGLSTCKVARRACTAVPAAHQLWKVVASRSAALGVFQGSFTSTVSTISLSAATRRAYSRSEATCAPGEADRVVAAGASAAGRAWGRRQGSRSGEGTGGRRQRGRGGGAGHGVCVSLRPGSARHGGSRPSHLLGRELRQLVVRDGQADHEVGGNQQRLIIYVQPRAALPCTGAAGGRARGVCGGGGSARALQPHAQASAASWRQL